MSKFISLPKTQLRNGAHFTEMEAFQTKLKATNFTPAKLKTAIELFDAALAEEDKYLKLATSSTYSPLLASTDDERDKVYSLIKQVITSWAANAIEPQATAAKALLVIVNTYKIDVHAQYDQETGLITNFITDITTTENAAHVETLGLTSAVARLKELNEQMKTLMASRSDESSRNVTAALKTARKNVDAAYDEVTSLIEAFSQTADDATIYDTFITEWNAEVTRVRKQNGVKTSATKVDGGGSSTSGDSSSSDDSGSSSDSGDNSGSDSGDNSGNDDGETEITV